MPVLNLTLDGANGKAHDWTHVLTPMNEVKALLNTTKIDYLNVQSDGLRASGLRSHDRVENGRTKVHNSTGGVLSANTLVYFSGTYDDGTDKYPLVTKAVSTQSNSTTFYANAIVESNIANGADGTVVLWREVENLNTSSGSVGDPVWLDDTAGGYVIGLSNLAAEDYRRQVVGVISVDHASTGRIVFGGWHIVPDVAWTTTSRQTFSGGVILDELLSTANAGAGHVKIADIRWDAGGGSLADNDGLYLAFTGDDSGAAETEYMRLALNFDDVTATNEDASLVTSLMKAGTLTNITTLTNVALSPTTTDAVSLGTSSLNWSDLFLDSGAVINFDSGNVTLTHSSSTLTVSGNLSVGGDFDVTGSLDFSDSNITNIGSIALDTITNDGTDITLDSSGDIILDAAGDTIFLKDAGTTFGSLDNTSGNLIIKSGTTTAATFSGANVTLAGTVGSGAITSTGTIQGTTITATTAFAGTLSTAAQTNITSLGTLTSLDVDSVAVDGKVITMTGSTNDTAVFTAGTHGTLTIETTDAGGAAANIQITADGTAELAGTTVTLDSGGDIELAAAALGDVNIPADIGLTFGDDGEKIEGDGTDLTISSSGKLNLTPTSDVHVANGTGVVIGHTAQVTANLGAMEFQVLGTGSADSSMILGRWSDNNGDPSLLFIKSREAAIADGSFDAVENNDALGLIRYMVDDGNDYNTAAVQTRAEVDDGSPIENQVGGAYVISTATTGGVMTEAMRIDSSQRTIVSGYSALQGSASANAGELRFGHTGRAKIQYGNSAEILSIESQGSSSSYGTIKFMTGGTPSEAMRIDQNGDVGIGTASPSEHLEIYGGSAGDAAIQLNEAGNYQTQILLRGNDTEFRGSSGNIEFYTGNADGASSSERMRIDANGGTYIGDSANGNMTVGLTVNMGPHDGQIVALKETGVNTGLTSATTFNVEIDDFLTINKGHATRGGTVIQSMALDGTGNSSLQIVGFGGTANTTKTTSGAGLVSIQAYEHDGSNALADTTSSGTVFSVTTRKSSAAAAVFLVDEDGDLFADGSATTVYDEHDDVALLSAFDRNLSLEGAKGYIAADWEKTLAENEQSLIDLDILGGPRVGVPVKERGLINYTGLARLHNSAIRQVYGQLVDTMKRLEIAESRIALLTA